MKILVINGLNLNIVGIRKKVFMVAEILMIFEIIYYNKVKKEN